MEIIVGKKYIVNYKDTKYPCDCECHRGSGVLHFEPCCSDRSYTGLVTCIKQLDTDWFMFEIKNSRHLKLHRSSVIDLEKMCKDYIKAQFNCEAEVVVTL